MMNPAVSPYIPRSLNKQILEYLLSKSVDKYGLSLKSLGKKDQYIHTGMLDVCLIEIGYIKKLIIHCDTGNFLEIKRDLKHTTDTFLY